MVGLLYLKGFNVGLGVVGSIAWSNASSFSFIAVPLFMFMSGILLHSGIGRGLYTAVARWVSFLPGGLAVAEHLLVRDLRGDLGLERGDGGDDRHDRHPGDGAARLRAPADLRVARGGRHPRHPRFPPSVPMIIYGVMTETSIGHLYMAGIIPGVILAVMFAGLRRSATRCCGRRRRPAWQEDQGSFLDKLRSLYEVAPVALLVVVVLGSMYARHRDARRRRRRSARS